MSQSDSSLFGDLDQCRSTFSLPFCFDGLICSDDTRETLSDVGDRPEIDVNKGFQFVDKSRLRQSPKPRASERSQGERTSDGGSSDAESVLEFSSKCQHFSENLPTPKTNNMGVSSSHQVLEGLVSGGLDTLEISLYGLWSPSVWNAIRPKFERARKRSEAGEEKSAFVLTDENDRLTVEPTGVRKGVYCRYVLQWNGCTISIVDNPAPSESRLSIHVRIGSVRLMDVGHEEAWRSVMGVLRSLGYEHIRDVVGRVDACIDLVDVSMDVVQSAIDEKRLVTRSRKSKEYKTNDLLETYVRGSGPVLVRIYDKGRECRNDPIKQVLLSERRWGKIVLENAIRVEFQLRNKALKRHFSIKTIADLFKHLGTITEWCTESWFRMTSKPVDRKNKNQSRAGVSEFWERVTEAFKNWVSTPLPRVPSPRSWVPDFKKLKQQAVGCAARIAAHVDGRNFLETWEKIGREMLEEGENSLGIKRLQLAAASRVIVIEDSEIPF